MSDYGLGKTLAARAAADMRAAGNLQFNQIQNTIIRRMNDEIGKLNNDRVLDKELATYQKTSNKLREEMPKVDQYLFENQTNLAWMEELQYDVSSLKLTLQGDLDDENVSADEVSAFNAMKDGVIEKLEKLRELSYPGISDGNVIQPIRNLTEELKGLTITEGPVDAAGTENPTNDNRRAYDILEDIGSRIGTAVIVTANTIELTFEYGQDIQNQIAVADAESIQITAVDAQKKTDAIDALRAKNSALLTAISLSFEIASTKAEDLSSQLGTKAPEKGSVLNMFV